MAYVDTDMHCVITTPRLHQFFYQHFIQQCFICRSSVSTVSEDAGIEPMQGYCNYGIGSQKL